MYKNKTDIFFVEGVCIFNMGEGVTQDRVWPKVPSADIQGEETG